MKKNKKPKILNKKIFIFLLIYFILFLTPLIASNKIKPVFLNTENTIKISKSIQNLKSKYLRNNFKKNNKLKNNKKISKNFSKNYSIDADKDIINKDIEKSQINQLSNIISEAKNPQTKSDINTSDNKINYSQKINSDGYFDILNLKTGKIERISEKDYVIGAVCAEMPPTFHPEALKAQAVCAHTYALKMRQDQNKNPDPKLCGADFSADPLSWKNYVTKEIAQKRFCDKFDEYWTIIKSACDEVIDVILLYQNEPIIAAYHAISSGKTESAHDIWGGEAPYLVPKESLGDNLAPNYQTSASFFKKDVESILNNNFKNLNLISEPEKWFNNIQRSDSGSVLNININNNIISGSKIRSLFNLRSSNFKINYDKNTNVFEFIVKGYGHDVGLSQYGANYMANNGADFKEILNHYYTNISFAKVCN